MNYSIFLNPNGNSAIEFLSAEKFPVKVAYKVAMLLKQVSAENETFNKLRQDVLKKYADLDDAGEVIQQEDGSVTIKDGAAFSKEWADLLSIEVPLTHPLTIEDLGDTEVSGSVIAVLIEHGFVTEPA